MNQPLYRLECRHPIEGRLIPMPSATQHFFNDRSLAISMAVKSLTTPGGEEVRVVHVPSEEVIFRIGGPMCQ